MNVRKSGNIRKKWDKARQDAEETGINQGEKTTEFWQFAGWKYSGLRCIFFSKQALHLHKAGKWGASRESQPRKVDANTNLKEKRKQQLDTLHSY